MRLAIFDVDGTLTRTESIDSAFFIEAFAETFGITRINTDYTAYSSATDSAVTREILRVFLGRDPGQAEITRHKEQFVHSLRRALGKDPGLATEVPGASAVLARLRADPTWAVAIATGGWRASATAKLDVAGVDIAGIPFASADDGRSREQIIEAAIAKAGAAHGHSEFESVVSVGDAVWDVRAARELGIPFVGVARGERAALLKEEGARQIVTDFLPLERFLGFLCEARPPRPLD
jgi:phosphoglycolate phosphatase-like HAD superfamily hydrolase